ncbi:MAG: hypothetical protein R3C61_06735 [Bacteroidia bacterium]
MRSPIFILLLVFVSLVVVFFRYRNQYRAMLRDISRQLEEMEGLYESVVKKRLSLSVLEDRNPEKEKKAILEEVMTVLRPEIQLLLAHIQSQPVPDGKLSYKARYFRLAVVMAETMLNRSGSAEISVSEIDAFFRAFEEGAAGDISRRIIDLKSGATL